MKGDLPDLKQLSVFLSVAEELGIGRAARALGVSQPYVSQEVQRLEAKLGHRLFHRNGRTIELTIDGSALVVFARSLLAVAERTRDYFSKPRSKGPIRIGLTEELARVGLIRVLGLFAVSHPGFRVEIETSFDSYSLQRDVREARLDLAVGKCFGSCTPGAFLWSEPVVWFGREGQDFSQSDPVPLAAPFIATDLRNLVFDRLNEAGRAWTIAFQSDSYACLEAAVLGGLAVSPSLASLKCVPGIRILEDEGLPKLPDANFFIERREDAVGAEEFECVLREVLLRLRREPDDRRI